MNYQEITTVEKAFEALGLEATAVPDFSKCLVKDQQPMLDHYLMVKVIEAINPPEFIADLSSWNQFKVYLWPDIEKDASKPSGFGFSSDGWATTVSRPSVGSRRAFADRDRAKHFWKFFQYLFESYSITLPRV